MNETFDWQSLSSAGTKDDTPAAGSPVLVAAREPAPAEGLSRERLTEALELMRGVAGGLAGLRAQLAAAQGATVTATSGGRHVSVVRKRDGSGLTLQLDERWLESAHERVIGREVLEALQAAHDEAVRPMGVLDGDGPIGQLRALTASPAHLFGWLGLPLPPA